MRTVPFRIAVPLVAGLLVVSGCGDGETPTSDASDETTVTTPTTDAADSAPSNDRATAVDANTASLAELTAAFEAAGIDNAGRWAREVEEYRPYPTDDPTFAKLRSELAKYNPSDEVMEQIIASLHL